MAGVRGTCLIVGPDGSGKSTIADLVSEQLAASGIPVRRANPRPGTLRPAPMGEPPVRDPHGNEARSTVLSVVKLVIILFDFWLGHLGSWRRARRSGVLLLERGWYDQVVDPRRYRLNPTVTPLALLLGRLLPRADWVVVAGGSAETIYGRCGEISHGEVARQLSAWTEIAPLAGRVVLGCDTTRSERQACADAVFRALVSLPGGVDGGAVPSRR